MIIFIYHHYFYHLKQNLNYVYLKIEETIGVTQ